MAGKSNGIAKRFFFFLLPHIRMMDPKAVGVWGNIVLGKRKSSKMIPILNALLLPFNPLKEISLVGVLIWGTHLIWKKAAAEKEILGDFFFFVKCAENTLGKMCMRWETNDVGRKGRKRNERRVIYNMRRTRIFIFGTWKGWTRWRK